MDNQLNDAFIKQLNENLGIAHKISRIYFDHREEMQDAIQEMMYQLWKSYSSFDNRSKFSTWMYRVCLNTALTFRKKQTRNRSEALSTSHYQIADEPSGNTEEEIARLINAIGSLSPLNKAIILLYLEDQSYDEIATITGLSKTNVSVRLVRIRKELEILLKESVTPMKNVSTR